MKNEEQGRVQPIPCFDPPRRIIRYSVDRILAVLLKVPIQLNQIRNNQVGGTLFAAGIIRSQTQ